MLDIGGENNVCEREQKELWEVHYNKKRLPKTPKKKQCSPKASMMQTTRAPHYEQTELLSPPCLTDTTCQLRNTKHLLAQELIECLRKRDSTASRATSQPSQPEDLKIMSGSQIKPLSLQLHRYRLPCSHQTHLSPAHSCINPLQKQ
ncbi:hypothetical protein J6590_095779 [Homalodisca vitripennis]|nr:hypothetical protein J6590_095779 [Homalodisca vitripennis]